MARITIVLGAILVAVGICFTIFPDSQSKTSLIPAFLGAAFIALGALAIFKPQLNHHLMHAAAILALLGFFGSVSRLIAKFEGLDSAGNVAQIITAAVCTLFLYLAVRSFKAARLARQNA